MTDVQVVTTLAVGVALIVVGLTWVFGPWALISCGLILALVALLIPVRERREPVDEALQSLGDLPHNP